MDDTTNWTPYPDDNLLGLTDSDQINESEATGITKAELFVFELDSDEPISTWIILEIHKIAFQHLYDWAGKWRTTQVTVGQLEPPQPNQVLQLMYQFEFQTFNSHYSTGTSGLLNICALRVHSDPSIQQWKWTYGTHTDEHRGNEAWLSAITVVSSGGRKPENLYKCDESSR